MNRLLGMKCQAFFPPKNTKTIEMSSAATVISALRGNIKRKNIPFDKMFASMEQLYIWIKRFTGAELLPLEIGHKTLQTGNVAIIQIIT